MPEDPSAFFTNTTMRWLPDPRVAPLVPAIEERVAQFAAFIRASNLREFLDPLMQRLIVDCFNDAGAHEGVIWMLDPEQKHLHSALQLGKASRNLKGIPWPVDANISGMVLAMQQPFCENNLAQNRAAASLLEEKMGVIICSRILVPFFIAERMRGVVACYRTKPTLDAPDPEGFETDAVEEMSLLARLLGRLLDHRLLCSAVGMEAE
jgi:hypothetical protein